MDNENAYFTFGAIEIKKNIDDISWFSNGDRLKE